MKKHIISLMLCLSMATSMKGLAVAEHSVQTIDSLNQNTLSAKSRLYSSSISHNHNYIFKKTYTNKQAGSYIPKIDYFDGFGRLVQTIEKEYTPELSDAVYANEYVRTSSMAKDVQWLPAIIDGDGSYNPLTESFKSIIGSYHVDENPFTTTYYELSPANTPLFKYKYGAVWFEGGEFPGTAGLPGNFGHAEKYEEGLSRFECNYHYISWFKSDNGTTYFEDVDYYGSGELALNRVVDEDGGESIVFKDYLQRTVMSKTKGDNGEYLDTYYFYDALDNLKYVFPPELVFQLINNANISDSSPEFYQYAYAYDYDMHNRLVTKKLPGADPVYMAYDKADRLVMTQDGAMRTEGRWLYTKYDNLGRVVSQSIVSGDLDRSLIQARLDELDSSEGDTNTSFVPFSDGSFQLKVILSESRYGEY